MKQNLYRARTRTKKTMAQTFLELSDTDKDAFRSNLLDIGIMIAFKRPYVPYLKEISKKANGELKALYEALSKLNTQGIDKVLSIYVN